MEFRARFLREVGKSRLPNAPAASEPVAPADLAALPEPAQRYLRFMGVVGRPRDWSFRGGFEGFFRLKAHDRFMPCEAWQYTSHPGLARFFYMRMRFVRVIPLIGRDTYVKGRGRMLIRMCDLLTVAEGKGAEYDASGLVSYLNDAVLIAPSMLLAPEVTWNAIDANSFGVSLADQGRSVSARVLVDQRGAVVEFTTADRYYTDPDDMKTAMRTRWTTPVSGWEVVDGRPRFTRAEARWHLPQGLFTYADFRPIAGSFAFNTAPGE